MGVKGLTDLLNSINNNLALPSHMLRQFFSIFYALQNSILFYHVYHFLRNINKTRGRQFEI